MSSAHGSNDIFDRLLEQRIIFIRDLLEAAEANRAVAQLLHLEDRDPAAAIMLQINCTQADLHAVLAIYDTMQIVCPPVSTLCSGTAAGGAALLLAAGAPGRRLALPSARVLLEPPRGRFMGSSREIDVQARGLLRLSRQASVLLARHTGQPLDRIERDIEQRLWLSAEEARTYGLVDRITGAARGSEGSPGGLPTSSS